MSVHSKPRYAPAPARQLGQAFLLVVLLLVVGIGALIFNLATRGKVDIERDRNTARALEQAKTALIGYAAGVSNLAADGRPGDLPCPDTNDSGNTGASCGNAAGTTGQASRIGRLPWKSLGLPDLRDGDGERLWYAVSNNFKYNNRTACAAPGDAGCLNSDTRGTITVRDSAGNVIHDGTNPDPFTPSGVIAVIFAPGGVLQRQGAATAQIRDCSGAGCAVTGVCNSTATAKCDPVNYLDTNGTEDNANFIDGNNANGFINGVIRDAGGNVIVNDRLLVITYQDLMPPLERRVAKEALKCLESFAADTKNKGRYPWASSMASSSGAGLYDDTNGTRFGRLPNTFTNTVRPTLPAVVCTLPGTPPFCMTDYWPASCGLTQGTWWTNWKNLVLYGVAEAYQPEWDAFTGSVPVPGGCGNCLRVNPPVDVYDKRVVVLVAGKRLAAVAAGQPRTSVADRSDPANYAEDDNVNLATSNSYTQLPTSTSFDDFLLYR